MIDTVDKEVVNGTLQYNGYLVRKFYSAIPRPVLVGIEATKPMLRFPDLTEELGIQCQIEDATKIRAAKPRRQKHDRHDAELILEMPVEKRFQGIWMPASICRNCDRCFCAVILQAGKKLEASQKPLRRS